MLKTWNYIKWQIMFIEYHKKYNKVRPELNYFCMFLNYIPMADFCPCLYHKSKSYSFYTINMQIRIYLILTYNIYII